MRLLVEKDGQTYTTNKYENTKEPKKKSRRKIFVILKEFPLVTRTTEKKKRNKRHPREAKF